MNVVGKVGSLITQGVYSVATPFHPFGGAVDIIVVEQQDGTYRSTPWYVRFGKFQGFLKGAEKIVRISVNGVEANFHMFLDNSGEAYFLREVVASSEDTESNDRVSNEFSSFRTSQCDVLDNSDDEHHNIYDGSQEEGNDGRKSNETVGEHSSLGSPSGYRTDRHENFEAENVVRSSEESNLEMVLMSVDGRVITAPISREEENTYVGHLNIPQFHLGPVEGSCEDFDANIDVCNGDLYCDQESSAEKNTGTSRCQNAGMEDAKGVSICESEDNIIGCNIEIERSVDDTSKGMSKDHDLFKSCLDLTASIGDVGSDDAHPPVIESEKKEESNCSQGTTACRDIILEETEANVNHDSNSDLPLIAGEQVVDREMKHSGNNINNNLGSKDVEPSDRACLSNSELDYSSGSLSINIASKDSDKEAFNRENAIHDGSEVIPIHSVCNEMEQNDAQVGSSQEPGISAIEIECDKPDIFSAQRISGFGFEVSLCGHLLRTGMGRSFAKEAFEAHRITEDEFKAYGSEIIKNGNLVLRYKEEYFMWDKVAHIIVGMALFGFNFSVEPTDSIPIEYVEKSNHREEAHGISPSTSSNRWRLWPIPFRPVKFLKHANSNCSNDDLFFDSESCLGSPCEEQKQSGSNNLSPRKQSMRTNMPTSEQIASMNLKDGQNAITFSFTTTVLGKQQVDAHVYLWKWNARIVISDVDGTITRSDVLGQVMPLVGRDWAQSGVARLFSAIKENGYQLLFLSARAIVQAYLTKSFLFNLKQDGNALPTGPVVISPDGLFPSLYREVIRRAPHEFKIACLQDIRALFPSDYNPFYAGFGNRDTDELSYKKIGIPEGKIFIINPKGEVALHNCNGMKTYTSLHTLVDDMFPPTSLAEQEDYNSWNYWKVPLPSID